MCSLETQTHRFFSVIQQPPSDRKSLSLLAVLLKADSIQCLMTDGCDDETYDSETKIDARLFLRLMQIFDASTTASWKARGVGQSFKGLGNGFITLRLELQTPRGTPSDVQEVALTINCQNSHEISKVMAKDRRSFKASCFH